MTPLRPSVAPSSSHSPGGYTDAPAACGVTARGDRETDQKTWGSSTNRSPIRSPRVGLLQFPRIRSLGNMDSLGHIFGRFGHCFAGRLLEIRDGSE